MSQISTTTTLKISDITAWVVSVILLFLLIKLKLLPALLAALTVYCFVGLLVPRLKISSLTHESRQWLAVALLAILLVAALTIMGLMLSSFLKSSGESLPALFARMAEIVEQSRNRLPPWITESLPDNAEDMRLAFVEWLRSHAKSVQTASTDVMRGFAYALVGVVIGAILSMRNISRKYELKPLTASIAKRSKRLANVFQRVVFAQVWISAINTLLTGIYLVVILPIMGIHLPFTKVLLVLTFVVGLIPILGNLISNAVIFIVSFSQSPSLAVASIVYLIVIHKLEYFLNARIVGSQIKASAWELLLVMLFMEAAFGIPGLIIGPMAYAFFKEEFSEKGLI